MDSSTSIPEQAGERGALWLPALLVGAAVAGALIFALWPSQQRGAAAVADVAVIARGEEVGVTGHLVAGKYTLIDFYADWCPNCRRLNPILEDLARREPRLAVRKVNILSWNSPVARQYGLTALPHLLLYSPEGELIAEGQAAWAALRRMAG